jgi:hypothetical protein
MHQLLVTANVVLIKLILVTLMTEALRSSETLVLIRATWHDIPEYGILHIQTWFAKRKNCITAMITP